MYTTSIHIEDLRVNFRLSMIDLLSKSTSWALSEATVSFLGRDKGLLEHLLEEGKEIQRKKREPLGVFC